MIHYIVNFVLCSGLLLLVYRVFLRNENLYRFNRFYLLFSLVFSLAVPFISIKMPAMKIPVFDQQTVAQLAPIIADKPLPQQMTDQVGSTVISNPVHQTAGGDFSPVDNNQVQQQNITTTAPAVINKPVPQPIIQGSKHYSLPAILLMVYVVAALVMLFRFIRNSYHIRRAISQNITVSFQDTKLVLLDEEVTPHSFLNYVFINKDDYQGGLIEPEILCHEQTHIRQLHSLDIILVELLQAVCWFNPFIFLYRKAIQLNHEFLADEEVLKNYDNTPAYQCLLLAKASQCGGLSLTSQFNYLATKKRLLMMTKHTSATMALIKKFALIPVLASAILLFGHTIMAQVKQKAVKPAAKQNTPNSLTVEYGEILDKYKQTDLNARTPHRKFSVVDKARLEALYRQMTPEQQKRQWLRFIPPIPPLPESHPTAQQLNDWMDPIKYGVWINDKRIKNAELAKYKASDFAKFMLSHLSDIAVKNDGFHYQVDLMTKAYYASYRAKTLADTSWKIVHIGNIPSESTILHAKYGAKRIVDYVRFPIYYPCTKEGASDDVLKEYEAIAGKYTDDRKLDHQQVKVPALLPADRQRLEQLFSQMSHQQQDRQKLGFTFPFQYPLIKPTQAQLDSWSDNKLYWVWIDGKRVIGSELASHQPDDFYHYSIGRAAASKNATHRYEVSLMTTDRFNSFNKKMEGGSRIVYYYKFPDGSVQQNFETNPMNDKKAVSNTKYGNSDASTLISDNEDLKSPKKTVKTADIITFAAKQTMPIVAKSDTKIIPPAKNDAPQSVMEEYATILKKYNLPLVPTATGQTHVNFTTSTADRLRLEDLFNQMSKRQQDSQAIRFGSLLLPPSKKVPTDQQLADWQNESIYHVWIDGKRIDPSELTKHKSSEFDYYNAARLAKTNPNYNKYRCEIRLMTPAYYQKDRARAIADRYQMPIYVAPPKVKPMAVTDKQKSITSENHLDSKTVYSNKELPSKSVSKSMEPDSTKRLLIRRNVDELLRRVTARTPGVRIVSLSTSETDKSH